MTMSAFFTRFRELAFKEMRVVTVFDADAGIPPGEYGFLELYCEDPRCDCQRVVIRVVGRDSGDRVWATINYGWESPAFYAKWVGSAKLASDMAGATLEPFGPQTQYSAAFLRLFEDVVCDENYVARLQRHYQLFKGAAQSGVKAGPGHGKKPRRRR